MIAGLPRELGELFDGASSAVLVTVDGRGHPLAAAVPVRHDGEHGCFELTSNAGLADPRVALLVAGDGEQAVVQGTAIAAGSAAVRVRPERVLHWPDGDLDAEPVLYDAHLEEVRAHHNAEPERPHEGPAGRGEAHWDERLDALAALAGATGSLAVVGPDGFPFAFRVPIAPDRGAGCVRLGADPVGAPLEAGPACLLLADPDGELLLRGDLLEQAGRWVLCPRDPARA
ncbi:MAG TPA: pyridoxamine 5'-phosphate oxidase family protein [Solirubrobacteraceae bacterium]|nr:pyridoxamine 5'-phosphate oxidase family protein [Solirubrobacteraceae bacterium]